MTRVWAELAWPGPGPGSRRQRGRRPGPGVDRADPGQQREAVRAGLRDRRADRRLALRAPRRVAGIAARVQVRRGGAEAVGERGRVGRRHRHRPRRLAGDRQQRGGRPLALAEARAAQPGRATVGARGARRSEPRFHGRAQLLGPGQAAGDVVADVGHDRRPGRGRQQRVERGHAVGLGRRHGQPAADVAQRGLADVADAVLQRVQRRQQQVAMLARGMAAVGDVALEGRLARRRRARSSAVRRVR